jgi:hypothetical protein
MDISVHKTARHQVLYINALLDIIVHIVNLLMKPFVQ